MNILVLLKMVPDVVEELEIAADGKSLDADALRMILSESDDHALEQALLLKERHGGVITVVAADGPEVDDALYTAAAKGADRVVKITGLEAGWGTRGLAHAFARVISTLPGLAPFDLILTGTQAIDDLDALVAPSVAYELDLPYVPIVSRVQVDPAAREAEVFKEYPGGVRGEFAAPLPAMLGIQSAEKPPRYVPVAKVRAAMKTVKIEPAALPTAADGGGPLVNVLAMAKPQASGRAEMLEGAPEEVAAKLCETLASRGLLAGRAA
jgi:electron transfer flavoprotein beta subunit